MFVFSSSDRRSSVVDSADTSLNYFYSAFTCRFRVEMFSVLGGSADFDGVLIMFLLRLRSSSSRSYSTSISSIDFLPITEAQFSAEVEES